VKKEISVVQIESVKPSSFLWQYLHSRWARDSFFPNHRLVQQPQPGAPGTSYVRLCRCRRLAIQRARAASKNPAATENGAAKRLYSKAALISSTEHA